MLNATLTLPGIAGVVLTVGIAVDSNVLIYERIRKKCAPDERRSMRSMCGFTRALATIPDLNITTFIAAAVLFYIGTGPVRALPSRWNRHSYDRFHCIHADTADRCLLGALAAPATRAHLRNRAVRLLRIVP